MIELPSVLIGPKDKLKANLNNLKVYDDKSYGFDYQEHLIRKVFNEMGSDINFYLIYEDYQKSAGFERTKIFPNDSAEGLKTETKCSTDKLNTANKEKYKKGGTVFKNCHWTPFLQFYIDNQFWKIEYEKYIKTLEHYKKAFYSFNYCHLEDYENWNNWL
jgi:hypothetical protein